MTSIVMPASFMLVRLKINALLCMILAGILIFCLIVLRIIEDNL